METGNVIHRTQIERGTTALYVSSKGDAQVWTNLQKAYEETDLVISSLTQWGEEPDIAHFETVDTYYSRIKAYRAQIAALNTTNITVPAVIKFYSDDNDVIIKWVGRRIQYSKSSELWKTLMGYYMLILSKEQAGVERALGSTFYAQGEYNLISSPVSFVGFSRTD
ncbi:guanylate cyclase 32E [Elysia marginata]|uniref:Guanylate cyclase 32E n=1 Tax=Elysia marginata TaxID=1093978 RepID=A0AAV4EW91_9GAST|nr:guanylate cyclase 32E [Elysia marginata]